MPGIRKKEKAIKPANIKFTRLISIESIAKFDRAKLTIKPIKKNKFR